MPLRARGKMCRCHTGIRANYEHYPIRCNKCPELKEWYSHHNLCCSVTHAEDHRTQHAVAKEDLQGESQSNNRPRVSSVHLWRAGRLVLKPWPAWMLGDCCRWLCGSASNHSDPKKLTESLTKQHHSWFYRLDHKNWILHKENKKNHMGPAV